MNGTNAQTGKALTGKEHLRQSITDILTTPIGSRVMRRDYGSALFSLIDAPINRDTITDIYAAVAEALVRWEPRFTLTQIKIISAEQGAFVFDLIGVYLLENEQITLNEIMVN